MDKKSLKGSMKPKLSTSKKWRLQSCSCTYVSFHSALTGSGFPPKGGTLLSPKIIWHVRMLLL